MCAARLRSSSSGSTVLLVRTQSSPTTPTTCRLCHSTLSPSAPTPIYSSMVLEPTIPKLSKSRAPLSVHPKRYPISGAFCRHHLGSPRRRQRYCPRYVACVAQRSSSAFPVPSTRSRHSGRMLLLANRIFFCSRTWSPCSSRPTHPLLPLLLRLLRRSTPAVASILRASRPLNQPLRPLFMVSSTLLQPARPLSTSPGRSAG